MIGNPPPSLTSPPWTDRTKRTVTLITAGLLLFLALQLLEAWIIVLIASILAYLLYPLVLFFENWVLYKLPYSGLKRSLAIILTFILVIVVISLIVILIVPPVVMQSQEFLEELPDFVTRYEQEVEKALSRPLTIGNQTIIPWEELDRLQGDAANGENLNVDLVTTVQQAAGVLSSPVVNIATLAVSVLFNTLFMFVIVFYLLKDGAHFINRVEQLTPVEYQGDIRRLFYELGIIWNAYLRGQLLLGFIVGLETVVAASLLGLPQPLVLGLIAGILEFIPNLGPILSAVPAVLFALISPSTTIAGLEGIWFAIVVMLTYTVIQQTEYLFLVPRIMGGSLDLHPVAILIGVISGAAIAGIIGVVLAAPVLASLRLLLSYIWGKLLDIDPFAQPKLVSSSATLTEVVLSVTQPRALQHPSYPETTGEIIEE